MKLTFTYSIDRWQSVGIARASFDKHPWNYKTHSTTKRTKKMRRKRSKHLEVCVIYIYHIYLNDKIRLHNFYFCCYFCFCCCEFRSTWSRLKTELDKPLVVLLQWLQAKPKHTKKYAELYIDHGYDVMAVTVTPWQVMWPTKGTQVSKLKEIVVFRW